MKKILGLYTLLAICILSINSKIFSRLAPADLDRAKKTIQTPTNNRNKDLSTLIKIFLNLNSAEKRIFIFELQNVEKENSVLKEFESSIPAIELTIAEIKRQYFLI